MSGKFSEEEAAAGPGALLGLSAGGRPLSLFVPLVLE